MGIASDIDAMDWHAAFAALQWQVELGVTEAMGDVPVNSFDLPDSLKPASGPVAAKARDVAPLAPATGVDPVVAARALAGACTSLDDLRQALADFPHCDLQRGARSLVFADGNPQARVLILGEAPGSEEDREGRPFVGRAGQLLDRMFAAIGLSRTAPDPAAAVYITNVLPWRPPGNRDPSPEEIAMLKPFVERHIALVDPQVIVAMGNTPLLALTGGRGILRARGNWAVALDRPLLPMTHPAYLLRTPLAKREAWADLVSLKAKLNAG